ncbi:MAG: AAA family ATPase [Chloroflexi bacterium]|nr:AAA family ATPase [Chloroflexota bacterium]MBU1746105.1 AAA family ATPase [Chloroflexota bacterium]
MTHIIAISNQKGGTGKTTVAINLGAALVEQGQRVLVIDCDPQAHATDTLLGPDKPDRYLYHLLRQAAQRATDELPLQPEDLVQVTARLGLDLLPTGKQMLGVDDGEFSSVFRRETLLQRALGDLPQRYDIVLLDCPPALGLMTFNALVAARWVLIPVEAEPYAIKGLSEMIDAIQEVQSQANPDLAVLSVVIPRYQSGARNPVVSRQLRDEVEAIFAGLLYEKPIPKAIAVVESQVMHQTILDYAPQSPVALAYMGLAQHILARLGGQHG